MRYEGAELLERFFMLTIRVRYVAGALSALVSWFC